MEHYYENVNVNKALTLQGVDSGSGLPVVDAGGLGSAITLSVNGCNLQDFVAMNSSSGQSGIRVTSSSNTISGNTATANTYGIYLISSNGNTISGNTATGNPNSGIRLDSSSNGNTISGNTANSNGAGILLSSGSGNTISGNTANGNANYGIALFSSSINTISSNSATGNFLGIYLGSSSGNTISSNSANSNIYGIYLGFSSSNNILGNSATGNTNHGINLFSSSANTISSNSANSNTNYGIFLDSASSNNIISGNTATANSFGIYLASSSNGNTISSNTATGNTNLGIYLISSNGNTLSGNTATGNGGGITLSSASSNTITGNIATGNAYGILLISSSNSNTISGNTATGNTNYGIYLSSSSSSNIIYLNTLDSGFSIAANFWNSTTEIAYGNATTYVGNNWSDYDGFDCDGDGIGDTAYPVAGGSDIDYHPIGGIPCSTCISGYKLDRCGEPLEDWTIFVDEDRSGTLDSGEPANVTDASGYWQICDLEAGVEVRVAEQSKAGWRPSQPSTGWQDITVQPDNGTSYVNFTNIQLLCISGYKLDENSLPLEDWNITLTNGSYTNSTLTDSSGKYEFCGLEPGDYDLSEDMQEGWAAVSAPDAVELNCTNVTDKNFVNRKLLCINGSKINNCTGEALANWTIELRDEAGALIDSEETDSRGDYSFCNLEASNYTVCELLQEGWKNVTPRCIPVTLDTDSSEDSDFANDPPVCINGTKINDCTGEPIAGWKITLYDIAGNKIRENVTDANGRYSFCRLTPGRRYWVCEEIKDGWEPVKDQKESVPPFICPTCKIYCKCVDLTCEGAEIDFRNVQRSLCINGTKINNCTGEGLAGWTIYLYNASGIKIKTTQTDRNGRYSFCGLAPGVYRICEEIRDGYIPVTDINHSNSSEICAPGECENCIPVILDCDNSDGNDFENIPPLSIKGKVIDDCTGLGLKGWTVKLYDGTTQLTTRTTGADGSYTFASSTTSGGLKLTAGKLYTVCEVVQQNWTPVTYHANTSHPASNEYCIPVFLDCGETEVEDFENIPSLCISGHEFNHCTGEGLDNWVIHLKDGAGNVLSTTTTDETGYYEFCSLESGWYTVCEDEIPEGWTSFRDDPDSPAMALPGTSAAPEDCERPKCIVVNLDYCLDSTDNDFENIPEFCIKGIVTTNNSSTTNEVMKDFPVKIENSDGSLRETVSTDDSGEYSLCGLKVGTYTVCVAKIGWTAEEPCAIVYLDCMDEDEVNFDVYKGRNTLVPGITSPAIILDGSRGAVVPGAISVQPTAAIEPDMGGDEKAERQPAAPEIA